MKFPVQPIEDWSFDDLVQRMSWHVMQGILRGEALESLIHTTCDTAATWHSEMLKRQKVKKK